MQPDAKRSATLEPEASPPKGPGVAALGNPVGCLAHVTICVFMRGIAHKSKQYWTPFARLRAAILQIEEPAASFAVMSKDSWQQATPMWYLNHQCGQAEHGCGHHVCGTDVLEAANRIYLIEGQNRPTAANVKRKFK